MYIFPRKPIKKRDLFLSITPVVVLSLIYALITYRLGIEYEKLEQNYKQCIVEVK